VLIRAYSGRSASPWRLLKTSKLTSDKRYVSDADDHPQVRSVANQLVHPATDFGHQKTVFQGITLVLCASANLLKGLLVQTNDAANVVI
jgi:transposase